MPSAISALRNPLPLPSATGAKPIADPSSSKRSPDTRPVRTASIRSRCSSAGQIARRADGAGPGTERREGRQRQRPHHERDADDHHQFHERPTGRLSPSTVHRRPAPARHPVVAA